VRSRSSTAPISRSLREQHRQRRRQPLDGTVFALTPSLLVEFDATGKELGTIAFTDGVAIDCDASGNIYVAASTGAISVYSPAGTLVGTIPSAVGGGRPVDFTIARP
jgi:hypothetical protein